MTSDLDSAAAPASRPSDAASALMQPSPPADKTADAATAGPRPLPGRHLEVGPDPASTQPAPSRVQIEAYWLERKRYLQEIKKIPELRTRYLKAMMIYLLRRLLWSFTFFPIFIAFWVPFVLSRFNPVAMVSNLLPSLQAFVQADPQAQAATVETLLIAWLSIGFIFAVFDFVLTPFKSPYEYEADVHMRAWEALELRDKN